MIQINKHQFPPLMINPKNLFDVYKEILTNVYVEIFQDVYNTRVCKMVEWMDQLEMSIGKVNTNIKLQQIQMHIFFCVEYIMLFVFVEYTL